MGKTVGEPSTAPKSKPTTIEVPPRSLLFTTGFSPGPMTLVSNLFPEQSPFSFSQLLAGAMASPKPESLSPLFILNSPTYLSPIQSPFGMSHQQALAHVTAQAVLSQSFKQMQAEFHHSMSKHPSEPSDHPKSPRISLPCKKPADNKPAGDGYNWRKYGQKHVKASEGPRSYYKCTQPDCSVKKKVERTLDGCVLDVTYKGEHNHDLPKHNKRGKDSCIETDTCSKEALNNVQLESTTNGGNSDNCHKEEPIAKRRSLDSGPSMQVSTHQAVSEPKLVLQTRSDVDLLDDGYKWRKYGQKVVKGNPYPRSYYKCTYGGCNVRKHVERASVDPKAVVTTYEGKHNHEIPIGKRANAQHLKTQKKKVSKNASIEEETDYGDKDTNNNTDIPMNLQLQQGQITP